MFKGLYFWDITIPLPGTAVKFMIKSTLYILVIKDADQAETEDWPCLQLMFVGQSRYHKNTF